MADYAIIRCNTECSLIRVYFAMLQQTWSLGFFGRGSGRVFCLIKLTSVKRRQVPRGPYERGTFAWTHLGAFSHGKAWAGWLMPCNLNPPAPPHPGVAWTRGLHNKVVSQSTGAGDSAGLGWGSGISFSQGFLVIPVGKWCWQPLLCSGVELKIRCGPCLTSSGSFVSFLGCLSYPQIMYGHVPRSISVNSGLSIPWWSLKDCNAAAKFLLPSDTAILTSSPNTLLVSVEMLV